MKTKFHGMAIAALALAFAGLVGGISASFAQTSQQDCQTAWDDSEAADVCTTITLKYQNDQCDLYASCIVNATLSDGTSTAATSWEVSFISNRSDTDTETLDVCFAASTTASNGYTAAVKPGCDDGESTSDDISGSTITVTSLP